jgi:Tripartite tricarboxylate transporter TctB family
MKWKIQSTQDFWTGAAFVVFGLLTTGLASKYNLGTTARMGPGYFPTLLGLILAGIGAFLLVRGFVSAEGGQIAPVKLGLVSRLLLSVVAFGFLLNPMGLFVAAFVTVLLASSAGPEFDLGEGIVTAAVLSASSWLVFVYALKQTMPVWPSAIASYVGL